MCARASDSILLKPCSVVQISRWRSTPSCLARQTERVLGLRSTTSLMKGFIVHWRTASPGLLKLQHSLLEFRCRMVRAWNWITVTCLYLLSCSHLGACSKGLSKDAETVIGASACLDDGCMQMCQELMVQKKSDVVKPAIMVDLIKVRSSRETFWRVLCVRGWLIYVSQRLAIQYYLHTGKWPKRVLVYRDGASDGSFGDILSKEVGAIRKAFYEIRSNDKSFECPNHEKCQQSGCLFCTPRITFVVAQNEHNIRVVPATPPRNPDPRKPENVPRYVEPCLESFDHKLLSRHLTSHHFAVCFWLASGTIVDAVIMGFRGMDLSNSGESTSPLDDGSRLQVFSSTRQDSISFLLVPQGGLKGTSKPVLYHVLLNENGVYKVDGHTAATALSKRMLEKMTYHMAFQCKSNHAWQLSTAIGVVTYKLFLLYPIIDGTATKAPRKVPVILYSERLASQAISYMSCKFEDCSLASWAIFVAWQLTFTIFIVSSSDLTGRENIRQVSTGVKVNYDEEDDGVHKVQHGSVSISVYCR